MGNRREEEVITCPTETVVNTNTRERIVKHIHPKEIINVHRTVIKHEHCYPVEERDVYETIVEGDESSCGCGRKSNKHRCCHRRRRNCCWW
ncbi:MAG: CotD family spore coat protein [Bacillus sp. (in: firmicutes)]